MRQAIPSLNTHNLHTAVAQRPSNVAPSKQDAATSQTRPFSPTNLLHLQRAVGNTAVQRLMIQRCGGQYHAECSCINDLAEPSQYLRQQDASLSVQDKRVA